MLQAQSAMRAPEVTLSSAAQAPVVATQYPAPYAPVQTTGTSQITDMLNAIMPIMMMVMVMGMMKPLMKSMS